MIVEYIRYVLNRHSPEGLIAAYRKAGQHLQAAPECAAYDLTACVEEPEVLILRILWQSAEAHMQGFRKGPHFLPFFEAVKPFYQEIAEMRHYAATPLSWTR